ncbi:MAG: sulfatase family protein, partial [Planctomycetota bacterium]
EYGYDEYGAFNCAGEQMPPHEDARLANKFIKKCHKEGKPFFINLWMHESHTPFHTLPKYRWRFPELEEADNIYASVLSHADDRIGEVLHTLDKLGIADNTLVIFSSDNGPARASKPTGLELGYDSATGAGYGIGASKGVTGGRKGYKGCLFEGGIGVPFIARWPGKIKAGAVNDASLISAVDLLPTFCQIAGANLPQDYKPDGIRQVDALLGKDLTAERMKPLFWKMEAPWPPRADKPDHWVAYATVYKNWKLVSNEDGSYVELYDTEDTYEKNDLKTQNPEVVEELMKKIESWKMTLPSKPDPACLSDYRDKPRIDDSQLGCGIHPKSERK